MARFTYSEMTKKIIDKVCSKTVILFDTCLEFYRNMRIWLEKAKRGELFI